MDVICFHNPNEENGYLSNWYFSTFVLNGVTFSSVEQYMMYRKAVCFGDDKVAAQILATDNVAEIRLSDGLCQAMMKVYGTVSGRSLSMRDFWQSSLRTLS